MREPVVRMPVVHRETLENGLRMVVVHDTRAPVFHLRLVVRAGWRDEPDSARGVARLTKSLIAAGTDAISAAVLTQRLDSLGIQSAAGTFRFSAATMPPDPWGFGSSFSMTGLGPALAPTLALLSHVIAKPAFPAADVARLRRTLGPQPEGSVGSLPSQTDRRIMDAFGLRLDSPLASIRDSAMLSLEREDVVAFHRRYYTPDNTLLVVVTDIAPQEAVDIVRRQFGPWDNPGGPVVHPAPRSHMPTPPATAPYPYIVRAGSAQTTLEWAALAPARHEDAFAAVMVLQHMLAERIWANLRDRGWTYGSAMETRSGPHVSMLLGVSAVQREHAADAVEEVLSEVRRFGDVPVDVDELELARIGVVGGMVRTMERRELIADKLVDAELAGLSLDYWEHMGRKVMRVTARDVRDAARRWLRPGDVRIAAVGDSASLAQVRERVERLARQRGMSR